MRGSLTLVVYLEVPLKPVPSLYTSSLPFVLRSILNLASFDKVTKGGIKGGVVLSLFWDGAESDNIIDISVVVLVPGVDDSLLEHGI